jgi:hypothetical protein
MCSGPEFIEGKSFQPFKMNLGLSDGLIGLNLEYTDHVVAAWICSSIRQYSAGNFQ